MLQQLILEDTKKYPKGEKAPINLLKLGISMVQIGEKDQGCKMINGVEKQYPKAKQSVIQKLNMSQKNSNVAIRIPKILQKQLNNKKIGKIYKNFEKKFKFRQKILLLLSLEGQTVWH